MLIKIGDFWVRPEDVVSICPAMCGTMETEASWVYVTNGLRGGYERETRIAAGERPDHIAERVRSGAPYYWSLDLPPGKITLMDDGRDYRTPFQRMADWFRPNPFRSPTNAD